MPDEKEDTEQGFRIKDRRRFDSDGNEKSSSPEDNHPRETLNRETTKMSGNSSEGKIKDAVDEPPPEASDISFSSFIMSLATQALMQLGELKPPPDMQIPIDKVAAKQTIDILAMLEFKSRNNLDPEEKHLLSEILHNLRLSFLRAGSK